MNKENLNELNLSELRVLCRNRELRTTSKTTKQSAISKISSYHQKKGYKQLQFKEKINEWRKAELVAEAKAVGAGNLAAKTKKNIVSTILNPPTSVSKKKGKTNDSVSDFESNSNNKNKNKKKAKAKAKKITKLSQKKQSIIACCKQLESIMIDVFNDLKGGYKPKHKKAAHQVHDFREYEELPILSNDLTYDLDDFGDKILALLPLVLEAKSMVHDFEEYINKINKLSEKKSEKQLYYFGIRKYAKKSNYENDPIGPVCGVFNDSKQFDGFRNDKKIQKKYGKNIKRFRFMLDDESEKKNNKNSKEADHKMDVDSESEFSDEEIVSGKVENEDRDDNASVATEEALDEKRKEKDDLMVSSEDEDEDEDDVENNEKNKNKAVETVINGAGNDEDEEETEDEKTEDEETEDENEADEEDQGDEDDDIDMEKNKKNKNRKNKKKNISKNTRSRRSKEEKNNKVSGKKRKRDGDGISGNEQKRKKARLNENETDVNPELPPVLSG